MSELSVFVDESGSESLTSKYYLLTLVFHDQSEDIAAAVGSYERVLRDRGLPDVPFHASPLLNGHADYEGMGIRERKAVLSAFATLVRKLPIAYTTLSYERRLFEDNDDLFARMRRDLVDFMFDNLGRFQSFERVKVYYDNGQRAVTRTLRSAISYALSREAVLYRKSDPSEYKLSQVADFLCTIELTSLKYERGIVSPTDDKFFGTPRSFRRNYLNNARQKRVC